MVQALAPDLLDLDIAEVQPAKVPDAQDLVVSVPLTWQTKILQY